MINEQFQQVALLNQLLQDTKSKFAEAVKEANWMKERSEMVEKAFEKTNTKLDKQKEEYELKLEAESRRIFDKTALVDKYKERADTIQKEYSVHKMEVANEVEKREIVIADQDKELRSAWTTLKEKNEIIEQMHSENVDKDTQILEGNKRLMAQISTIRLEAEEYRQVEELRQKHTEHTNRETMDYVYRAFAQIFENVSCLGCDKVTSETISMLFCGHCLCKSCLDAYSQT